MTRPRIASVRWVGFWLVIVSVTFSACGLVSRKSAVQRTLEESGANLSAAIDDYLALNSSTPQTEEDFARFFDEGDRLLSKVRLAYENWTKAFDNALSEGAADDTGVPQQKLEEFRDAVGAWISDQEEQAQRSRRCFSYATRDAALACYSQMIRSRGPEWQANADRVNRLQADIFGGN